MLWGINAEETNKQTNNHQPRDIKGTSLRLLSSPSCHIIFSTVIVWHLAHSLTPFNHELREQRSPGASLSLSLSLNPSPGLRIHICRSRELWIPTTIAISCSRETVLFRVCRDVGRALPTMAHGRSPD